MLVTGAGSGEGRRGLSVHGCGPGARTPQVACEGWQGVCRVGRAAPGRSWKRICRTLTCMWASWTGARGGTQPAGRCASEPVMLLLESPVPFRSCPARCEGHTLTLCQTLLPLTPLALPPPAGHRPRPHGRVPLPAEQPSDRICAAASGGGRSSTPSRLAIPAKRCIGHFSRFQI